VSTTEQARNCLKESQRVRPAAHWGRFDPAQHVSVPQANTGQEQMRQRVSTAEQASICIQTATETVGAWTAMKANTRSTGERPRVLAAEQANTLSLEGQRVGTATQARTRG